MTTPNTIAVAPSGEILGPPEGQVSACVLDPCKREGRAGDWWTARHTQCTGSHHVGPGQYVRCACSCHPPLWSEEKYLAGVSAIPPFKAERCECGKSGGCHGWRLVRLDVPVCACGHVDEDHRYLGDEMLGWRCDGCECRAFTQVSAIAEYRRWESSEPQ